MKRRKSHKPYWDMTTEELQHATKQFDEEFVAEKSRALTPEEKEIWQRVKSKGQLTANGRTAATITVRLEKQLLKRSTALAKKKRMSRDALIARGLRAMLAANGE